MPTPVLFTVDTALAWRHHAAGYALHEVVARSIDPASVGLDFIIARFAAKGLKASFFVDPMPAIPFGLDPIRRLVDRVLDAGQEVQLGLHPNWAGARADDGGKTRLGFALGEYPAAAQRDLIEGAVDLLIAAGAPPPIAFRAGGNAATDATLDALADLGFSYDSSHNGGDTRPRPSIALPLAQIAPVAHRGVVEVPVALVGDGAGRFRPFRVSTLSIGELRAALDHAARKKHVAVTIALSVGELANRAGTRANGIHVRRFEALCAMLADSKDMLTTVHFADRPALALGFSDAPHVPTMMHKTWRNAEQLWSNLYEERAA